VRMSAVEEVGRMLANDGISTGSVDSIIGLLAERFGRPYLSLYMADDEQFRLSAQRGHASPFSVIGRGGQLATALRMRKPWVVPNQSAEPESRTADDLPMELCIPLLEESETLGLLFVGYPENAPIGEAEIASFVSVANRITDAVGLANEQRDVSGRSVRMHKVGGFLAQLAATASRAQLEAQLAPAVAAVVDVSSVLIGVAIDADHIKVISSHGVGMPAAGAIVETDLIARRALRESRPASFAEPQTPGLDGRTIGPGRWSAALPLIRGRRTFGVVQFSRPEHPFDVYERETVTFFAALVALLLSNSAPEA
jgi:GAF domain-containing protein